MVCEEKWWSNRCDNKNDDRYNTNVSPDISNLDPIFSNAQGLWKGNIKFYNGTTSELESAKPAITGVFPLGPRPYGPIGDVFYNITIAGTRWEQHDIYVLGAAPQSFCDENPGILLQEWESNVADDGVCGENGFAYVADAFKTSTHEKNDILVGVSGTGFYLVDPSTAPNFSWTVIPSGEQQLVEALTIDYTRTTYAYTFSSDFSDLIIDFTIYNVKEKPELASRVIIELTREEDESKWLEEIETSMINKKVTANTMATYGTVPTTGQCSKVDVGCPTLEMWCDNGDASPLCGPTPYIEETTVNAGVIAGITVAIAIVIIAAVVYLMQSLHKKRMATERERIKNDFARRIVATFAIGSGGEAITQEKIIEEFQRIDSGVEGGDGRISKAEMKAFLVTTADLRNSLLKNSVGGQMKDNDFETLFALIDEDGSGDIDFAEYCAFMGHIKTNIDQQANKHTEP